MSAEVETLRRAASLMRDRARGAAEPWFDADDLQPWFGSEGTLNDATHIASWHPAVALAVADWLESLARRSRWYAVLAPVPNAKEWQHGLAVARAFLGEEAS